jgi:menaquinone-dependent protoporphyrinogen IX oxidase
MTVAIVYADTHGHTGKIVDRIAGTMRGEGWRWRWLSWEP